MMMVLQMLTAGTPDACLIPILSLSERSGLDGGRLVSSRLDPTESAVQLRLRTAR